MKKEEQLKKLLKSEEAQRKWVANMVASDLKGPKRQEVIAFLQKILEEDCGDPSFYKIQFMKFHPKRYYGYILLELDDILSNVSGIVMQKDESLCYIQLSFHTLAALEEFKQYLPLGYSSKDDRYEFIERRRHETTKKWEVVIQPILWEVV